MIRIIAAIILLLLGAGIGQAVAQRGRPTVVACFELAGMDVRTMYVDTGATSYYPLGSEAAVETTDGVVTLRAEVHLREPRKVYVPVIAR